jgi:3-deoxy-D-manno-octulosonate 8-phosphate phosphatase (KDO 8-P phosphatase)
MSDSISQASIACPGVLARARKIKLFLMDVDGTLTDCAVLISTPAADGADKFAVSR